MRDSALCDVEFNDHLDICVTAVGSARLDLYSKGGGLKTTKS